MWYLEQHVNFTFGRHCGDGAPGWRDLLSDDLDLLTRSQYDDQVLEVPQNSSRFIIAAFQIDCDKRARGEIT